MAAGVDKVGGNVISYWAAFQAGRVGMWLRLERIRMWTGNVGALGEVRQTPPQ